MQKLINTKPNNFQKFLVGQANVKKTQWRGKDF